MSGLGYGCEVLICRPVSQQVSGSEFGRAPGSDHGTQLLACDILTFRPPVNTDTLGRPQEQVYTAFLLSKLGLSAGIS